MSRVGNSIINIPDNVEVKIEKNQFFVKGPLGELKLDIYEGISVEVNESKLVVKRINDEKQLKSMHGLTRALIFNNIKGVTDGFTKKLELIGVGYRASNQGQVLDISVGFSHNIVFEIPDDVKLKTESEKGKAPIIILSSINKQLLGHVASKIRSFRKPEPYKGKGIRYVGEYVRKKAGKTAAS